MLLDKSIPIHLIELRSASQARTLYVEQLLLQLLEQDLNGVSGSTRSPSISRKAPFSNTVGMPSEPHTPPTTTDSSSTSLVLPVLRVLLSHSHQFLIQGQILDLTGIRSGSKQAKIKRILIGEGLIHEHRLQKNRNFLLVWEPTDRAYDLVNIPVPSLPSKGGWLHKFAAFHISRWASTQGYLVDIEFFLPNGKAVDLVLRRGQETVFIEVAISRPFNKEIKNILLDTQAGLQFDRLIIAVANSKVKESVEMLLQNDHPVNMEQHNIEVQLIGCFVETRHSNSEKGV